jgi:LCP family protein required for cell wall assembly
MTEQNSYPTLDPQGTLTKKPRRRVRWGRIILLLIIICLAGAFAAIRWGLGIKDMKTAFWAVKGAVEKVNKVPPFHKRTKVNILVLGADVTFGSPFSRTDVIKLVSVDMKTRRMSVLTIPRDTWVELPNGRNGRINGAYSMGSSKDPKDHIDNAINTVAKLVSANSGEAIDIQYFVRLQPEGLVKIIDKMGGVKLDVEKKMKYSDPSQNLFIDLEPGMQLLNGYNAMCYARFRHDKEGDYGRIERQKKLFKALATKMKDPNEKIRVASCAGDIMEMMYTNLSLNDMLSLKDLISGVGMADIDANSFTLPTHPERIGGAAVVVVNGPEDVEPVLKDFLDGPRPTIVLLNGTKTAGQTKKIEELIDSTKYNIIGVGNTKVPMPVTTIYAPKKFVTSAQEVATSLGLAVEIETKTVAPAMKKEKKGITDVPSGQITVVIGDDYTEPDKTTTQ